MPVEIMPMAAEEAATASELIGSLIQSLSYYNERARTEEVNKYTAPQLMEQISEDPDSVLLAKENEEIVGFCISKYDDGLIWLSWFGVLSNHRKQGIGEKMLVALEESVHRRRSHKIWCDTRSVNVNAQSVLRKAGFVKIASLENHWYGQDFFLWEKVV